MSLFVGVFAGAANAQQGTSAVRGHILDSQDAVLPGVTVVVTQQNTGIFRETVTGSDGQYVVTNLMPGAYRITAELSGFKKLTRENIALIGAATQTLDLKLEVGTLEQNITVTAQAAQVDVTSAAVRGDISLSEVQSIPSAFHTMVGYLQVVPGAVYLPPAAKPSADTLVINGQGAGAIGFYLDGGANYSGQGSFSTPRVLVPSEVVQEITSITSQMPAEYGGKTGAIINAITKQGTNAFRGSTYGFYVNNSWVAPDALVLKNGLQKPETTKRQIGVTLGGPIVTNKLFFFGLLEYSPLVRGNPVVYPANPERSFSSQATVKGINWFGRIDHQINASNMYGVRVLQRLAACTGDPGCRAGGAGVTPIPTNGPTLETLNDEDEVDTLYVVNYNKVVSSTKLNVFTYSSPIQHLRTAPTGGKPPFDAPCSPCLPTLRYLSFDTQANYFNHYLEEPHYRFEDAFSWFKPGRAGHGSHELKFGGSYSYASHLLTQHDAENGIFSFPSNRPFNAADPSTYPERLQIRVSPQATNPYIHLFAGYAQDKWQWTNQLTVNLGVRYDLQFGPTPNDMNPLFTDRTKYPIDWNHLQPRLGFAYSNSDGKAVIRGGFGLFTSGLSLNGYLNSLNRLTVYGQGLAILFPADRVDPGPSSGRLPTDPMLVNGPVVNRALLNQLYPPDTILRNTGIVYLDNPDRVIPTNHQATIGYQREFLTNLAFTADYLHYWSTGVPVQYNLNPGLRASTSRTAAITRVDLLGIANTLGITPFSTDVFTFKSDGEDRYDGLNIGLNKRFSNSWSARVSYTLSNNRNNGGGPNTGGQFDTTAPFQVLADHNLTWGPSAIDHRHVLSLSGSLDVPRTRGLNISGSFRYMSGTPFTIFNSNVDTDRNGIFLDPLPAGTYTGSTTDAFTIVNGGGVNGAVGPAFDELDLRLGYRFRLSGGRTFEASFDTFNLMNVPNWPNPSGDQRLPTFLVPNTLSALSLPRQYQMSFRMAF